MVMIKSENENYSLSSSGDKFMIEDTTYQEVVGSKDADVRNDEVQYLLFIVFNFFIKKILIINFL